jgi:hypothetical protein
MPFPGFNDLSAFTPTQRQQLEQFESYLQGWLQVEHTDGGGHAFGLWTAVPFAARNFTASAGTWGVDAADQIEYRYSLVGKTMTLRYDIRNTDVSNAAVTLKIALPSGFVGAAGRTQAVVGYVSNNGGALVAAVALIAAGSSVVELFATLNGGTFALTAADNTLVFGTLVFEVQ